MISKASELLEEFIKEESIKLQEFDMPHMPTLGSAYEEITKEGVASDFSIPKHLGLKVVKGFISIAGTMLEEQIDCMLVHGEAKKYGLTDQYIYPIEQVLCVFEVKKTLRKEDLHDSYNHLKGIKHKFSEHFENLLEAGEYEPNIVPARKIFSQITGSVAPESYLDLHKLPEDEGMIFYTLVQETLAPLSIIHGYSGYKTERGLRTAFIDFLEETKNSDNREYGVSSIPTLVTSSHFSLVKANGLPFVAPNSNREWVVVLSSKSNPAKLILKLLWSKISVFYDVTMPWGNDLDVEKLIPLLTAVPKYETDIGSGWLYRSEEYKGTHLKEHDELSKWKPNKISKEVVSAIGLMAFRGGYLSLVDGTTEYLVKKYDLERDDIKEKLLETIEFMIDGSDIRPINRSTYLLTDEDGSGWVSSDIGRFDQWCSEEGMGKHYLIIEFVG